MKLSQCCQAPPKTIVSSEEFSFCSKCGNWINFIAYGEDEEQDDFDKLETEFRLFRDRVSAVMDFYSSPSNYIVSIETNSSSIQMDQGRNARELLTLMEKDYESDNVDS